MRARLSEYAAAARKTRRLVTVIGAIGLASLATFTVVTVAGCGTAPTKLETRFGPGDQRAALLSHCCPGPMSTSAGLGYG
jgi:hypothetical protein